MIFAAGLGTRLKPLTDTMPKALVPLHGRPLISHVIGKLMAAGFDDFVVNVHHFSEMLKDYLASEYKDVCKVSVSEEQPLLLETGGGIKHAEKLLTEGESEDSFFLVHNVDILSNLDVDWFVGQWRSDALAVLLVSERVTQRYLIFNDEQRLVGWTNIATGEVKTPFPDLDVEACHKYAFSGIHMISDSVFDVMRDMPERFSIVDFYLKVAAQYPIYGVPAEGLKLVDVGKVATLEALENQAEILSQLP